MACGVCGGNSQMQTRVGVAYTQNPVFIEDCDLTVDLIKNYKKFLECCKDSNVLTDIGITTQLCNSYLGYFQSALNYPDNYCYYNTKIQEFITNVLPKILINVPNCTK